MQWYDIVWSFPLLKLPRIGADRLTIIDSQTPTKWCPLVVSLLIHPSKYTFAMEQDMMWISLNVSY